MLAYCQPDKKPKDTRCTTGEIPVFPAGIQKHWKWSVGRLANEELWLPGLSPAENLLPLNLLKQFHIMSSFKDACYLLVKCARRNATLSAKECLRPRRALLRSRTDSFFFFSCCRIWQIRASVHLPFPSVYKQRVDIQFSGYPSVCTGGNQQVTYNGITGVYIAVFAPPR